MKVMKDFRNELLKRREVKVLLTAEKNPGIKQMQQLLAQHFKSSEEEIVVKALKSKFGRDTFLVDAFLYDSVKDKEMIEPKKKVKKKASEATEAPKH